MSVFKSRGGWVGIGLVALFVGLVVLRVVQATAPEDPDPTVEEIREAEGVPVEVATADRGTIEVWNPFTGTVSGDRDATLGARTGDPLGEVLVSVGDEVTEDEVLVRVAGDAIQARVRQAETSLRQAERMVDRLEPLHEAGAISEQEWEDAETQYEMAREELAAVRENATLTSPLSGTVTEVLARPGMVPDVGEALVRVADLSGLVVRMHVSGTDARRLQPGQPVRLSADPAVSGWVRRVALQADPLTRLVEVEVEFPADAGLIPGTSVTVEARTAWAEDVVSVPRAAVRDEIAWVIDEEGRAERREVTSGVRNTQRTEIVRGVREGERVVVEGASLLGEGTRVRVVSDDGEER